MVDIYDDLKNAKPEELINAVCHAVLHAEYPVSEDYLRGMRFGFNLAQPGGWQHLAPIWLRNYKKYLKRQEEQGG